MAIEQKELCEYDMMEVLDHILSQIASYLKEGGELLSEEEVLQDLRSLGEDVAVPLKIRVEALSLAEKVGILYMNTKDKEEIIDMIHIDFIYVPCSVVYLIMEHFHLYAFKNL